MALIQYGSTVAAVAGSIGGATYARNRYGAYIRNRTKPIDPGTNNQNAFRTRVSAAVAAWSVLTQAQQLAFNEVAKTTDLVNRIGQTFHPSGINLFIRQYNLHNMAGITQVTTPPATPIAQDYGTTIGQIADTGIYMQTDKASWPADAKMLVWRARNKTAATYFFKGPYEGMIVKPVGLFDGDDRSWLWTTADMTTKTAAFFMWRLVCADGSASHARRDRQYWETT